MTQTLHNVLNQFFIRLKMIIEILLQYRANVNIYNFNNIIIILYCRY
jgi:hypothetical protein